jgi:5-formyltetrahydrofolate cyclo-ligase
MSVKDKAELRQQMWDRLEQADVVRFPGAHGRIPNFAGAQEAAQRLAALPIWRQAAQTIKCNPDSPQRPVRFAPCAQEGGLHDRAPVAQVPPSSACRRLHRAGHRA